VASSTRSSALIRLCAATSAVLGLGAAFAAILPAQTASAATWTVTDCSGSPSDTASLPYAVANAGSGDTITITASCPSASPIVLQSALTIGVSLTISGPGASSLVVSGGNFFSGFIIDSGVTASISGLTVEDGKGTGAGGIYNGSGTLTLIGSTVTANLATASAGLGAGIYNNGGTVTLTSSTVSSNSSSAGYGGGIYNLQGSLALTNSTVSGNSTDHAGGGIYSNNGPVTLTNSTVSGNTVSMSGGGIYNAGTGALTISASTVSGNTAAGNGGGIYSAPSATVTSTISNSTVAGNTVSGADFGAGIYNSSGTLSVTSSTVTGNGGAHDPGGIDLSIGTIDVGSTILAANGGGNCLGAALSDQGYNIDDDASCAFSATGSINNSGTLAASLGSLANNGGPTLTVLPSGTSPAVGQIPPGTTLNALLVCAGTDQRGYSRPGSGQTDWTIGAVEVAGQPASAAPEFSYPLVFPLVALAALGGLIWFRRRRTAVATPAP
jgi:predicted outer membrane repeat protein